MFTQHNTTCTLTQQPHRKRAVAIGTDIHLSAEVKKNGEWTFLPGPVIDCWSCDGTGVPWRWEGKERVPQTNDDGTPKVCQHCTRTGNEPGSDEWEQEYYGGKYVGLGKTRDHWYSDRNYVMFAILGNVRNGSGFAGVETFTPLPSISDSRGIPADATPETLAILSDEHSGTWCTLEEAEAYAWDQDIHNSGVIGLDEYARLRVGRQAPDSWSGSISGHGIVTVTMDAANVLLAEHPPLAELTTGDGGALVGGPTTTGDDGVDMLFGGGGRQINGTRYYVRYRWTDKLDRSTAVFRQRLAMLREAVGDRECRLVFDFDS